MSTKSTCMIVLVSLASVLAVPSVTAQEYSLRFDTASKTGLEIPPNSTAAKVTPDPNPEPEPEPEPEKVTRDYVVGNFVNLETDGVYTTSDGTIVSTDQVARIIELTQQGHAPLIGFHMNVPTLVTYPTPPPNHGLGRGETPYYANVVNFQLPVTVSTQVTIRTGYRSWTWPGDGDKARYAIFTRDESNTPIRPHLFDTAWFDNNKDQWFYPSDRQIPIGASSIQLYGGCLKYAGVECSAGIRSAWATIEADLPPYGSTITFTENPKDE